MSDTSNLHNEGGSGPLQLFGTFRLSPDTTDFAYGADGQRIMKEVIPAQGDAYREHYVRDAQGNIMAIYRATPASLKLTERPLHGAARLGALRKSEELYAATPATGPDPVQQLELRYELTDHLGNVCAVLTGRLLPGNGMGSAWQPEVVAAQGYEPFGSLLPGRNYSSSSYRWGFNGKPNDNEWHGATGTMQDYGMRAYDTRIGRPITIDPIAASFPELSPYQFFSNNPILNIDLDGLEGVSYTQTSVLLGQSITTKVVELDIYIAVSDQKGSVHYQKGDVARIVNQYREDYPSGKFQSDGVPVDFVFNFKTIDVDNLPNNMSLEDYKSRLRGNPDNYRGGQYKAVLLEQAPVEGAATGSTTYGHMKIDPSSSDSRRTRRHEMGHVLTIPSKNKEFRMGEDPAKHEEFGGVFIGGSLTQRNVDDFMKGLPEVSPRTVEMQSVEERKGL